jgi:drug/metabolite transporter (DMT)-like permease
MPRTAPAGTGSRIAAGSGSARAAGARASPLADAHAITFIAPLLITVLSIPVLGERVGWRRWSAVLAGFAGVLIVIRPGFGMAHAALALPLVTALGFALYQVLTHKVSGTPGETSVAMLFHLAWVGAAVMTAAVPSTGRGSRRSTGCPWPRWARSAASAISS